MPYRVPFRGDGFSKDFKPLKRFVNLKEVKRLLVREIIAIIAAFAVVTIIVFGVILSSGSIEGTHIIGFILFWIVVFTVIAGILDLNKFQKGRDVDTSKWDDDDNNETMNDNNVDE